MTKTNVMAALAFFLSTSSYSAVMKGATILEEHSWVTGGNEVGRPIAGHIEPLMGKLSASTYTSTADVSGYVNSPIYTTGYHSYRIDNNTGQNSRVYN